MSAEKNSQFLKKSHVKVQKYIVLIQINTEEKGNEWMWVVA